jgi:hypothetical protein
MVQVTSNHNVLQNLNQKGGAHKHTTIQEIQSMISTNSVPWDIRVPFMSAQKFDNRWGGLRTILALSKGNREASRSLNSLH